MQEFLSYDPNSPFQAKKIAENVYWVGAIDWSIRDFHGYSTSRGTTYNAFLVLGEKNVLIDTVKAPFKNELLARIASVINPTDIDFIISNHAEMDHSGCLVDMVNLVKPEKVYASELGVKALGTHFQPDFPITAVKNGEILSLGNNDFHFLETKFLHWPDSMFTYLPKQKILFSQDAFGMHIASYERFADEHPACVIEYEAAKYYANILMLFASIINKLIEKITSINLPIDIICPDHGPVWRKNPEQIIQKYQTWAARNPSNKAVIIYDTMWNSCDLMARAIGEGITSVGAEVKLMPLKGFHRSDVVTELLDASALVVGSPNLNNNIFPTITETMGYFKGLKPKNYVGAVFSSYGWSHETINRALKDMLTSIDIEVIADYQIQHVPTKEHLTNCFNMGKQIGLRLISRS